MGSPAPTLVGNLILLAAAILSKQGLIEGDCAGGSSVRQGKEKQMSPARSGKAKQPGWVQMLVSREVSELGE